MRLIKIIGLTAVLGAVAFMSGCAAVGTAVSHRNLETSVEMSQSVFLDPTANTPKTVFVQIRNTTDKPSFNVTSALKDDLRNKGYHITNNASAAGYILQVSILKVGKMSETAAKEMMGNGYGGAVEGVVAGAVVGGEMGGSPFIGGLVGGLAGTIADNMVKDVNFAGIVDVKLQQKVNGKLIAYTTRIAITADKVNLSFETAQPKLEAGLTDSLSGLF
jgi:hypothetical protein